MELNPFTITNVGGFPLDMRGEVDDCALFRNTTKWKVDGQLIEFPSAFGVSFTPEERLIQEMDEKTGFFPPFLILPLSPSTLSYFLLFLFPPFYLLIPPSSLCPPPTSVHFLFQERPLNLQY